MLDFLDSKLELFSNCCYHDIFKLILKKLWNTVFLEITNIALPFDRNLHLDKRQIQMLKSCAHPLKSFFFAQGEGLDEESVDAQINILIGIFDSFYFDTDTLIEMHTTQHKNPEYPDNCFLKILSLRGEKDPKAKEFVRKNNCSK